MTHIFSSVNRTNIEPNKQIPDAWFSSYLLASDKQCLTSNISAMVTSRVCTEIKLAMKFWITLKEKLV